MSTHLIKYSFIVQSWRGGGFVTEYMYQLYRRPFGKNKLRRPNAEMLLLFHLEKFETKENKGKQKYILIAHSIETQRHFTTHSEYNVETNGASLRVFQKHSKFISSESRHLYSSYEHNLKEKKKDLYRIC